MTITTCVETNGLSSLKGSSVCPSKTPHGVFEGQLRVNFSLTDHGPIRMHYVGGRGRIFLWLLQVEPLLNPLRLASFREGK